MKEPRSKCKLWSELCYLTQLQIRAFSWRKTYVMPSSEYTSIFQARHNCYCASFIHWKEPPVASWDGSGPLDVRSACVNMIAANEDLWPTQSWSKTILYHTLTSLGYSPILELLGPGQADLTWIQYQQLLISSPTAAYAPHCCLLSDPFSLTQSLYTSSITTPSLNADLLTHKCSTKLLYNDQERIHQHFKLWTVLVSW